jgi:hypothetical protein
VSLSRVCRKPLPSQPCTITRFWSFVVRTDRMAALSMHARRQPRKDSHPASAKSNWTRNVNAEADTSILRSSKSTKVDVTLLVQSAQ